MSIRTGLLAVLTYVLLLALLALGLPLALNLGDRVDAEVRVQSQSQADVVAATASGLLARRSDLDRLADTSARSVRGRVLIVDQRGVVLADSAGSSAVGRSYRARPEIRRALNGRGVQEQRRSETLNQELLATTVPVLQGARRVGAVRITQSVAAVHRSVRRSILGLVALCALVLVLAIGAGLLIARQVARPVRRLEDTARRVAGGELESRAPIEGTLEQRSLARSFNAMTERLAEALESQRRFVADASHQLRTPLTGLRLRVEEARATSGEQPVREELDAALSEVDRLSAMVAELLLLSQAGQGDAPTESIDLGQASVAAVERWTHLADSRGIALMASGPESAASVTCSRAGLERALDVLVENALRYSPEGSEVTIAVAPGSIEVLDRGPGLRDDEERQVFERFHRGSAGRNGVPGTGLGLPIAQELAREWDAVVRISNRSDSGAVASIRWDA